jgi:hypothetical protein
LSIFTSDTGKAGSYSYTITVDMIGVVSGTTLHSEDYALAITIEFDIEDYLSATSNTYGDISYILQDAAETQTYSIGCLDATTSAACDAGDFYLEYAIDDVSITSSSDPVSFDTTTGQISVSSSTWSSYVNSSYNYVITVKLMGQSSSSQVDSVDYNLQVTITYDPEDYFVGTA